jgi:hypothetical protein
MSQRKEEGGFIGICMSCKKKKLLQDFSGLKLCHKCEEKFYDELFKEHDNHEFGRDVMRDDKNKKVD